MHASGLNAARTVRHPDLTIQPVRWSFLAAPLERSTVLAITIVAAFTAARLVLSQVVGFGVDESYILSISRDLQLSYLDHPPLHIWLAHFSQDLFGQGHAVRLPFVVLSAISSWLMYALTRKLFGSRAGILALLAFNLSAFFLIASGSWVLPDGPLDVCLLGAALAATELIDNADSTSRAATSTWIKIGIWLGLGALAKYHAVIVAFGLLGFLLTSPSQRHRFAHMNAYIAPLLALLLFSPVLVWNAQHAWASFLFQGDRGAPQQSLNVVHVLLQIVGQMGLLLPWIVFPLVYAVIHAFLHSRSDDRTRLCLWLGLPIVVLFTVVPLWGDQGMPHWPMPGWLLLFPLLGAWLAKVETTSTWPRTWLVASAGLTVLLAALSASDSATGWVGSTFPRVFQHGDPTIESVEWTGAHSYMAQRGWLGRQHLFVVTPGWMSAGKIDQVLNGDLPVHVFGLDPHGYAYRRDPGGRVGDDAILIAKSVMLASEISRLRPYFASVGSIVEVQIGRGDRRELTVGMVYAKRLLKPYPIVSRSSRQ